MNSSRGLGVRDALNAVDPRLEFEPGKRSATANFRDDLLVTPHAALAGRNDFNFPTPLGGISLVHADKIARKQSRFVAAGPRANFENDVPIVHRVLRQK